jgi:hypothetical protein
MKFWVVGQFDSGSFQTKRSRGRGSYRSSNANRADVLNLEYYPEVA